MGGPWRGREPEPLVLMVLETRDPLSGGVRAAWECRSTGLDPGASL